MSTTTLPPRQSVMDRVTAAFSDTAVVAGRNLRTLARTPQALIFATIQPVIFVLLFRYAFGGAIHVPGVDPWPASAYWPAAPRPTWPATWSSSRS